MRGFATAWAVAGVMAVLPAAGAWAEFVYVTPAGTGPGLERAAGSRSDAGAPAEAADWRVEAGESLRVVLARWGARAGVEVLMLTDRRYVLGAGRAYRGSFAEAVAALLAALSHLPAAPAGELSGDGRRLAVTHSSVAGMPAEATRRGAGSL